MKANAKADNVLAFPTQAIERSRDEISEDYDLLDINEVITGGRDGGYKAFPAHFTGYVCTDPSGGGTPWLLIKVKD